MSGPPIIRKIIAESAAQQVIGPITQNEFSCFFLITPDVDTRPNVGLSPTIPDHPAGTLIDPKESVPIAKGHKPRARTIPFPLLLPPEYLFGSQGLIGDGNCLKMINFYIFRFVMNNLKKSGV